MLDNDPLAHQFSGGTIYQAFLSTTDYHRWHSPVTGTVIKAHVVPGTYYALSPALRHDNAILTATQAYLSAVATRALVFIESDNPDIGLMCFIAVGMIEVSSCEITVKQGERVKRGEQLGMFHYGGSTHCLVFCCKLSWTSRSMRKPAMFLSGAQSRASNTTRRNIRIYLPNNITICQCKSITICLCSSFGGPHC